MTFLIRQMHQQVQSGIPKSFNSAYELNLVTLLQNVSSQVSSLQPQTLEQLLYLTKQYFSINALLDNPSRDNSLVKTLHIINNQLVFQP